MKKLLLFSTAILVMIAASCQKEAGLPEVGKGENVTLTIQIPEEVSTKSVSQADNIDVIYYEIWTKDFGKQLYPAEGELAYIDESQISRVDGKKTAMLEVSLVAQQTYEFVFWAQARGCAAYDVKDLTKVKVDYNVIAANGNQDKYDAFYANHTLTLPMTKEQSEVIMTRPFAQLNFGATKMNTDVGSVVLDSRYVTVKGALSTVFDTIKGEGSTSDVKKEVKFKSAAIMDEALWVKKDEYTWVSMDYMLMPGKETTVTIDAEFNLKGFDTPVTYSIGSVPLKQNYRTNILGDLFTEDATLKIVIDHRFNPEDNNLNEKGERL